MPWFGYLILFLLSNVLLYVSGERLVRELISISRLMRVREFIVAFFVMAGAASLPNLLVGIHSAIQGTPSLSLGDIMGNNLVAMTLGVAVALILAPKGVISAKGTVVQTSALFTSVAAIAPLLLLLDGTLSRPDGLILLGIFAIYTNWIIQTQKNYSQPFHTQQSNKIGIQLKILLRSFGWILVSAALLLGATYGIVISATFWASWLGISLVIIGIIATGLGNALPEVYFAAISARRGETGFILGNLMGAVMVPATLVLGIVTLIHPIAVMPNDPIINGRLILVLAAGMFYVFARSGKVLTRSEGISLAIVYCIFIGMTIFQIFI